MMIPVDDGGSFERLAREADEAAKGNEELKERLLTERIVREFAHRLVEVRAAAAARASNKTKNDPSCCLWGFDHVPKRSRSGSCSHSKPPQPQADHDHDHRNKKRCFDQIHTSSSSKNNNIIVQEQKQRRKITTKANINKNKNRTAASASQVIVARPEIPERFKNKIEEMGGSKVVRVIQKQLFSCDTTNQNNRLSIPFKQIENNFLEPEEKQWVVDREKPIENVKLIEPCLNKVTEVTLKKWKMSSTTLNLITTWHKEVVCNAANQLQIGSTVQLYAFRLAHNNNELCFALVNLDLVN